MSLPNRLQIVVAIMLVATVGSVIWACNYGPITPTPELIAELGRLTKSSAATAQSEQRITEITNALRTRRYKAFDDVLAYRDRLVSTRQFSTHELERLDLAIDKIAGQKFASESRLYWHTSMGVAKMFARKLDRPILSLRMLGRLDENESCANSRFFRTTLYPDPQIAETLREHYVLHWEPVRDVPIVTIDFGEGRQLRQPLTGNSAHLVLDHRGRPFDVMPGLVSPRAFNSWLKESSELWSATDRENEAGFWASVADYHRERADRRRAESTLAIREDQQVSQLNPLDPRWVELAAVHNVELAPTSLALLQRQQPRAEAPMRTAFAKSFVETPMLRLVQPIQPAIARDTVFNLYAMQTKIDDWFASTTEPFEYQPLTEQIYAEVFLMPLDDPWLGLSDETRYGALDNGGRFQLTSTIVPTTAHGGATSNVKNVK